MTNITVGKYIPGESLIHKMNPRLKLATNITFIVLVFLVRNIIFLSSFLGLAIGMFLLSGLRKRQLLRMLIPVTFISIFLFLVNAFLVKEGYTAGADGYVNYEGKGNGFFWEQLTWWKFHLSDRVVFQTLFICIRIYIMIIFTTLLTATTRPIALTRSIEDLLLPLKLLFIPVHIIAMIISIALRFIPTLLEEAQRIMKAQASRGVDFKNGNMKSKAKSMITLIIPLFVSAFSKAEDLANAMETRGYDPYAKRTRYRAYPIKWLDVATFILVVGIIVTTAFITNGIINPVI